MPWWYMYVCQINTLYNLTCTMLYDNYTPIKIILKMVGVAWRLETGKAQGWGW